jgi:hypothetical protein
LMPGPWRGRRQVFIFTEVLATTHCCPLCYTRTDAPCVSILQTCVHVLEVLCVCACACVRVYV